jgi:hypothetical protein
MMFGFNNGHVCKWYFTAESRGPSVLTAGFPLKAAIAATIVLIVELPAAEMPVARGRRTRESAADKSIVVR